jgi:hypothetical protein
LGATALAGAQARTARRSASVERVAEHDPEDITPEAAVQEDEVLAAEEYSDDEGFEDGEREEYVDELGRRHVRRAAPEGTEELLENEAPRRTGLPDSVERWRQRSATGAVLTAFAFGLQQALETEKKEPAIIMVTSGDPPTDLPVEAQLEQLGPRQSSVKVRTWLLPGAVADKGEDYGNTSSEDDPDREAGDE